MAGAAAPALEQLAQAAAGAGQRELAAELRQAEQTEAEHLARVRSWIAAAGRLVARPTD